MALIEVTGLKKSFGDLDVLRNINFEVEKGDVVAVLGTSGSGKSTMLRCLVNLEQVDGGTIRVQGQELVTQGAYAPAAQIRDITSRMGMVFQNFNLFPHLNVRQNLEMPARLVKKLPQQELTARCNELLGKVGLLDKANAMPRQLSGGQQQRVAIARALMLSPDILLFDEPTSALDPKLTGEVLSTMRQLAQEHMTMIVVTHEMGFARDVASKVIFMSEGEIVETAPPAEFFSSPRHRRAREFLSIAMD